MSLRKALLLACCVLASTWLFASGHGPVFGYATPTNSRGEWSFDFGLFGRQSALGTGLASGSMFTYGFTPHLQTTIKVPVLLNSNFMPVGRMMGGMEWEGNVAWRFHHDPASIGRRLESTAFAGVVVPSTQATHGPISRLAIAPGINLALASGLASRAHYFWAGAGYTRYLSRTGDRRPQILSYSLVYGYRPPALRKDYPRWDWRVFAEMTGEAWSRAQQSGAPLPGTSGHQVFLGPTVLGIYKSFAVSGGVQLPLFRQVGTAMPRDNFRFAVNFSYFLFSSGHSGH
jgi:hypothetical protein